MNEEEIIKKTNEFIDTLNDIVYDESDWYDYEELESAKEQLPVLEGLLDLYKNLKEIEEEHRKENGLLRVELEKNEEKTELTMKLINANYIHKDKIKTILGVDTDSEEALLSLLETIVDENNRLEDIEDRKVQIEYNNVFNKGVESVKDKIKELAKKYEYASVGYDSSIADYKQSQDIGRYIAYIELLNEELLEE